MGTRRVPRDARRTLGCGAFVMKPFGVTFARCAASARENWWSRVKCSARNSHRVLSRGKTTAPISPELYDDATIEFERYRRRPSFVATKLGEDA